YLSAHLVVLERIRSSLEVSSFFSLNDIVGSLNLREGIERAPSCDKANVKKGPWSSSSDAKLREFIEKHGTGGNWIALPRKAGLNRCGKSCRLRWLNYLRPNVKHGEFSKEEDRIICNLFANIGSRWPIIASQLPGRTDNDIKYYWNTKLKKKILGCISAQRKPHQ
ncbi:Myb-like DNA-binding domain, partial [Musa troglodytarum]